MTKRITEALVERTEGKEALQKLFYEVTGKMTDKIISSRNKEYLGENPAFASLWLKAERLLEKLVATGESSDKGYIPYSEWTVSDSLA